MLVPSYVELMNVLNQNATEKDEITTRYTVVIAVAKRARQIIEGDDPMVEYKKNKPVSTAVEEIFQNKIKIVPEGQGTKIYKKPKHTEPPKFKNNKKAQPYEETNLTEDEILESLVAGTIDESDESDTLDISLFEPTDEEETNTDFDTEEDADTFEKFDI